MKQGKTKTVVVHEYDALIILHALEKEHRRVKKELELLELSQRRQLDYGEREELPEGLRNYSREELAQEINPWISLSKHYEGIIADFDYKQWPEKQEQ